MLPGRPKLNVTYVPIPHTREKPFIDLFPNFAEEGYARVEPGGYVIPASTDDGFKEIYQMQPRKDDAWIITFPKSGTTWVSELVWLLKNNLDYEAASQKQIIVRAIYPEMLYTLPKEAREDLAQLPINMTMADIEKLPDPRVLRPHVFLEMLPPDLLDISKVFYVARNPKDVIVSYYHYHKLMAIQYFTGDFDTFVEMFMKDELLGTPYFRHVKTAWAKRHHPNFHFMFYEDLKLDLRGEIKKAADFLGKSLTEAELDKLEKHLHFSSFEGNKSVNQEKGKEIGLMNTNAGNFMRKGIIGDWKNHFSPELNKRVDEWIAKNLADTDLKFVTE